MNKNLCVYAIDVVGYRYAIRPHTTPNKTICVHYEKHTSVNCNSYKENYTMKCDRNFEENKTKIMLFAFICECEYACVINTNHL